MNMRLVCPLLACIGSAASAAAPGLPAVEQARERLRLHILRDVQSLSGRYLEIRCKGELAPLPPSRIVFPQEMDKFRRWGLGSKGEWRGAFTTTAFFTDKVIKKCEVSAELFSGLPTRDWLPEFEAINRKLLDEVCVDSTKICSNFRRVILLLDSTCKEQGFDLNEFATVQALMLHNKSDGIKFWNRDLASPISNSGPQCGVLGIPRRYWDEIGDCFPELRQMHAAADIGAILNNHISEVTTRIELEFCKYVLHASASITGESILAIVFAIFDPNIQRMMERDFFKEETQSPVEQRFLSLVEAFANLHNIIYFQAMSGMDPLERQIMAEMLDLSVRKK